MQFGGYSLLQLLSHVDYNVPVDVGELDSIESFAHWNNRFKPFTTR
jgi:hypothetical protein